MVISALVTTIIHDQLLFKYQENPITGALTTLVKWVNMFSLCEHWTKRSLIVSTQVKMTTPKKTTIGWSPHHIDDYKIYITYGYVREGLLTPTLFRHCANSYVK